MNKREFAKRRAALLKKLGKTGIAVIPTAHEFIRNNDAEFPFRPHSNFYYLTGFAEPEAVAVLAPGSEHGDFILFCRERDPLMETWNGRRAGLEGAQRDFGAKTAFAYDQLDEIMPSLLEGRETLYYPFANDAEFDAQVLHWVAQVRQKVRKGINAPKVLQSTDDLLHEARLIKSPAEIKHMQKAADVSAEAHCEAMRHCKPGMFEYEVEAEIARVFRRNNCATAYNSIVGGGENGCILHYTENNARLMDGDLLLIDAGAEYHCYAGDITRTFPVNGRFGPAQKALYELVLKAQYAAIAQVKPGNAFNKPHETAVRVLTKGLVELGLLKGEVDKLIKNEAYRKFYMHNTSHWLGMDVHDVGAYKIDGKWRKLKPGMVLTIEPGLYIAPETKGVAKKWKGIGIRIEDDVLVTRSGHKVLTDKVPKDTDEIERLMAEGR